MATIQRATTTSTLLSTTSLTTPLTISSWTCSATGATARGVGDGGFPPSEQPAGTSRRPSSSWSRRAGPVPRSSRDGEFPSRDRVRASWNTAGPTGRRPTTSAARDGCPCTRPASGEPVGTSSRPCWMPPITGERWTGTSGATRHCTCSLSTRPRPLSTTPTLSGPRNIWPGWSRISWPGHRERLPAAPTPTATRPSTPPAWRPRPWSIPGPLCGSWRHIPAPRSG
mmetsp:Transcript_2554/g.6756  ORF Transcript_2554/g.6756 Transcript_2554/m.6756 type:complete len:226 (-) Transcript_2554:390-1067(-)